VSHVAIRRLLQKCRGWGLKDGENGGNHGDNQQPQSYLIESDTVDAYWNVAGQV
jgi:hypothetical protein